MTTANVTFCATRWDAWYSNTPGDAAAQTARSLSSPEYQSRAPLHASLDSARKISWAYSQATVDAEISAALSANVGCWAFLRYTSAVGIANGLTLFKSSTNKGAMKWASMSTYATLGSTGNFSAEVSALVAEMGASYYQKVGTNRPLMFIYATSGELTSNWGGSTTNVAACITALRSAAVTAGLGTPYIVLLGGNATTAAAAKTAIGADAISAYVPTVTPAINGTYAALDTATRAFWASMAASGAETVPICALGFDSRPRVKRPLSFAPPSQKPYFGLNAYYATSTNAEAAAHVAAAVAFVNANAVACPQRVILCYAWNEHDEGGWMAPTVGDPTGARLTAIGASLA